MPKTILLTGATDGIGLEAAKLLAADGHRVLLHGRSAAKLDAALAAVEGLPGACEGVLSDLSIMADVETLATAVSSKVDHLDVLINNAGILKTPNVRTADDVDIRFAVNTLAPYLLAKRLLPLIPADGRIVNLSSAAQAPVSLDALKGQGQLADMEAYSQSKLAITAWSRAMAQSLPDGPLVVSVNPGSLLATKMVQEGFGIAGSDVGIGADIVYRAAVSDEFEGMSGAYYDNDAKKFGPPHPDALNTGAAQAIMAAMDEILTR